jgi:hypothetical protein
MPSLKSPGRTAGNRQINANTSVTIGLVVVILGVAGTAIYKAGEVITDLSYVKVYVSELRGDVAEVKRIIQRIDRQQSNGHGR